MEPYNEKPGDGRASEDDKHEEREEMPRVY